MMELATIALSLGSSAAVAGPLSVVIWYKLGRIEQKLLDLPCSGNGFKTNFQRWDLCPANTKNDNFYSKNGYAKAL